MSSVICAPFIPISFQIHSHRAAQGCIYADLIKEIIGRDIHVSMSRPSVQGVEANEANKTEDFNVHDTMYVYHGNDWKDNGDLNLFGGVREFPHAYNFRNFSRFKGPVYSIVHPFPNYHDMLKGKLDSFKNKHGSLDGVCPEFLEVDWENLKKMQKMALRINPWGSWNNQVAGDSHAICMYRPGWNVNSIPFKTLHGALEEGLDSFIFNKKTTNSVEFYFGNIDIRHHILRHGDVKNTIESLVDRYIDQVHLLPYDDKAIYELLPIENERRNIPKSGFYKGTPFFGSWHERNEARLYFKEYALKKVRGTSVRFIEWITTEFYNGEGELDFKVMERPKSVHLSRKYYPYWQGLEYNGMKKETTLESFFS